MEAFIFHLQPEQPWLDLRKIDGGLISLTHNLNSHARIEKDQVTETSLSGPVWEKVKAVTLFSGIQPQQPGPGLNYHVMGAFIFDIQPQQPGLGWIDKVMDAFIIDVQPQQEGPGWNMQSDWSLYLWHTTSRTTAMLLSLFVNDKGIHHSSILSQPGPRCWGCMSKKKASIALACSQTGPGYWGCVSMIRFPLLCLLFNPALDVEIVGWW